MWALASFLINVFVSGISIFALCWFEASLLVALAVFLGLAYLQRSFWMIPGAIVGSFILIGFFWGAAISKKGRRQKSSKADLSH